MLTDLIGVSQVSPLPHFLSVTLTPAKQVIHPTIMYGLFHNYPEPLPKAPLFYQTTDDFTVEAISSTSNEVLEIARAVKEQSGLEVPVPSLDDMMREMYGDELKDPSTMKSIFRTNRGYKDLIAPMIETEDGRFAPNFQYSHLTEDIPRGQCVLKGVAQIVGVNTPTVDRLIRWAGSVMDKSYLTDDDRLNPAVLDEIVSLRAFGFHTVEAMI